MDSKFILSLSLLSLFAYSPDKVMAKAELSYDSKSTHLSDIKSLTKNLTPHDETMKDLIVTQDQKNAVLKNIDNVLRKKNRTIFEYMKLTEALKSKISKMGFKERIDSELKKRELSSVIEDSDDSIDSLKGLITEKELKIQYLQKLLKSQNTQLAMQVKKLNFKIKRLTETYNSEKPIETNQIELESKHHEVLRTYQNKMFENQRTISEFKKKFKGNQKYDFLIKENTELASSLRNSQVEIESYKKTVSELETKYLTKVREYKKLETFASNMEDEYNIQMTTLKSKYNKLLVATNTLPKTKGRVPASVDDSVITANKKIQEEINMEGLGHLIEIDPQHMKMVLDEKLFFQRGSTELKNENIENIKRIMTVYSNEIFKNSKLKERLLKVQVIGHSSPFYKGKFVDPVNSSKEAYDANMEISLLRAKSFVQSMFSADFPNKNEIRSRVVISGKSFSQPMMKVRGPASQNTVSCGDYDCEGSQRVEILFEFEKEIK